jgi:apolipoprotein N-acyltransferase
MTTIERAPKIEAIVQDAPRAKIGIWWAVAMAVAAGAALLAAFPIPNQWWLAPIGVGLLAMATRGQSIKAGIGLGALAGAALFVPLLTWTQIVGGPLAWLLLAGMQTVYFAALGAASAITTPLAVRRPWTWPLITGVLWVGQEALRDRTPFGGFPWGRLAFSQGDAPTLRYAVLGGAPLVTFVVAAAGGLLALAGWLLVVGSGPRWKPLLAVGAALAIFVIGFAVPTSTPNGKTLNVAIVQGNVPRLGLEFNAQRRAVLDNHVRATLLLAEQVADGTAKQPDLVIWPENSSDIDPLVSDDSGNADAAAAISLAAARIKAPILVGAVLEGPGTHARNAAIVWWPDTGPGQMYIKQHPVPFAEYVPLRSLARMVSKRVDLVRNDFLAGDRPGVLDMGVTTVGDAICFEVAYDNIVRNNVIDGAGLLTTQTNNADFNTAEARQQLAMVRLRAVEHGRDGLMVSTVGISGFVDASGAVHNATGFNVPSTQLRALRVGTQRTLATDLGEAPEFAASALALAALIAAVWLRRRDRTPAAGPTMRDSE